MSYASSIEYDQGAVEIVVYNRTPAVHDPTARR